jgi:hypothetical protein
MDKEQFTIASHVEVCLLEESLSLAYHVRQELAGTTDDDRKAELLEKVDSFISKTQDRLSAIDHIVY